MPDCLLVFNSRSLKGCLEVLKKWARLACHRISCHISYRASYLGTLDYNIVRTSLLGLLDSHLGKSYLAFCQKGRRWDAVSFWVEEERPYLVRMHHSALLSSVYQNRLSVVNPSKRSPVSCWGKGRAVTQ